MSRFYWGADNDLAQIDDFVWYFDNSEGMTQEVGQRSPNSFGLYDMGGNVWEWCQDWYGSYSSNSSVDPTGPATGTYRVQRGGSWASDSAYCRAAVRSFGDPAYRDSTNGFRVVMPESTSATPSAAFSANLTSGTAPLTVAFTDTSLAGSSTITGWMWSFGDGLTSSVRNPQHTYATAGAYDVSLTVTSNSGSDTELKPDFISVTDIAEGETEGEQIPAGQIGYLAGIEFAWCPPGSFSMGSPETEKDRYSNEGPQHTVTISHGFWLSNCEVTKAQWQTVMATTPWNAQSYILSDPNSPAVFISWNDITGANGFIPKMTLAHPNHGIRLPTEAEWEYACRAGTQARFFWGDDPSYAQIGAYAWYDGNAWSAGEQYAHVVGQKAANLWGLHDMSGNVWEWCQDLYGVYPSGNVTDPTGPTTGASRVLRGGSWSYLGLYSRSAHRFSANAGSRNNHSGFRLVAASMDE
jgi:formylglycine-generating enzyme required for sulfatase activity